MSTWTTDELRRVADAVELRVASRRVDGTLRPYVTIWHVGVGNALYIRSAHGPSNGWFRRAQQAGVGRISAGGVERDVTFEPHRPTSARPSTRRITRSTTATGQRPSVRSPAPTCSRRRCASSHATEAT